MANVIQLTAYRNKGNGAREAIQKYFKVKKADMMAVDHFLASLWAKGFVVVPLGPDNNPARKNPLEIAWEKSLPERIARHQEAVRKLGRKPRR